MTDEQVQREFEICWNGGELLPPHPRTSSLWQATQEQTRRNTLLTPAIRVQKRYTFEEKVIARRMYANGITVRVIARHLGMPDQTVRGMVNAQPRRRVEPT